MLILVSFINYVVLDEPELDSLLLDHNKLWDVHLVYSFEIAVFTSESSKEKFLCNNDLNDNKA